jgi:drug/metabolite transporter (DMT)-like permease
MDAFKKEVRFVVKISAIFALLWFASNYAYNYGLLYTSVTSSVILSSTNPTWIYLISLSCIVPQMHRK